jgi:hypothetical protein
MLCIAGQDYILMSCQFVELDSTSKEHSSSKPNDALESTPLFHCDIDDITSKVSKQVSKAIGMKRGAPGLSFMEKEQEKITLQPKIYRKENKQHQIENQRLSIDPFERQE